MSRLKTFALVVVFTQLCALGARAEENSSRLSARPDHSHKKSGIEKLSYKFFFGGTAYSEARDDAAAAEASANLRMDYRLLRWMKLRIEPRVELFSSRLQERIESDEYRNKMRLDGTYLSVRPVREFEARVGAIRQDFQNNALLVSRRRVFPGIQELFSSNTRPVKLTMAAEQVIPTSATLSDERESKEAMPSFQTQGLSLSGQHELMQWEVNGGHFNWSHLPDKVSFASGQQGNTLDSVEGDAVAGAKLKYGFDGFYWGGKVCVCGSSPLGLDLEYSGLHNQSAPNVAADGQMWSIAPHLTVGSKVYEIKYSNYFLESDATVAKYARRTLGFTNRVGDIIEASVNFRNQGFRIVGQWVNARTIADSKNALQATTSQYSIWVETEYASF